MGEMPEEKIKRVGNIMIDTLSIYRQRASMLEFADIIARNLLPQANYNGQNLQPDRFVVVTIYRPTNLDEEDILLPIVDFLKNEVAKEMPVVWPIHPRARKQL